MIISASSARYFSSWGRSGVADFGREERIAPYRRTTQQIKTPDRNRGVFNLRRGALLLLAALLAALSGLLVRLLVLLTRLLLVALILIVLGHSYLQFFVKYCLNVITQPTHFS
jgi:hypothetical protein